MQFASAITGTPNVDRSLENLLGRIAEQMPPEQTDLALLFLTPHYEDDLPIMLQGLADVMPHATILGCTGEGVLGDGQEMERQPAISLWCASLPGVEIRTFRMVEPQLEAATSIHDWERITGASPESNPIFIAFADPFKFHVMAFVEQLNQFYPGCPLIGGIASAGMQFGQNRLFINKEIYQDGCVGLSLEGNVVIDSVVSQGCKPIGKPFIITKGERNVLFELGGKPPLLQLKQVLDELPPADEELARQALFVGRVIDEYKSEFSRGDFLIQTIIGFDQSSGAIAINGFAKRGATVQFNVRDAASADEDLRAVLVPYAKLPIRAALLFGCNGRGTRMWPFPGHDVVQLQETVGKIPVGGFFCGGEFGPVGGKNFIHGFTASIALFREKEAG